MRILHLFNTAGIASVIAKYQRRLLHDNAIVYARKVFDPFGFGRAYHEYTRYCIPDRASIIKFKALVLSPFFDIIHVHSSDEIQCLIKKFVPLRRKVILHYHGTKIRGNWRKRRKYWSTANIILASTKDLLKGAPSKVQYLPNPVDTELFRGMNLKRKPVALLMVKHKRSHMWNQIKPVADGVKKKFDVDYQVIFCSSQPVPYINIPRILNRYEWFFDIPHGPNKLLDGILSATALQALACGCKVLTWWSDQVFTQLQEEHKPENVVKRLSEIYEEITK